MQTCHRRRSSCPNFNVWHRPMPPAIVSPGAAPLRSSGGGRDLAIFSGGPRSSMWVKQHVELRHSSTCVPSTSFLKYLWRGGEGSIVPVVSPDGKWVADQRHDPSKSLDLRRTVVMLTEHAALAY